MSKGVMFLSTLDFTDNGIQVVKLTPEYFARKGWNVHYVVARDNSKHGSCFYQNVVNPEGVVVHRFYMPSFWLGEQLENHILKTIYSKLRSYFTIFRLAIVGYGVVKNNKIDVIYGGGPYGVLASGIIRLFCFRRRFVSVSRFYGVWDFCSNPVLWRKWLKLLLNIDVVIAMYLRSSRIIVTNDGSQGDKVIRFIRLSNNRFLRFFVNGVDANCIDKSDLDNLKKTLNIGNTFSAVCVTRLVPPKRVDRCVKVAAAVVKTYGLNDFRLIIVGEGCERHRLEQMALDMDIGNNVVFVGSVDNKCVKNYLAIADVFLSMYDVSNVGNPLLEAVRASKIIFTLNNGDTSVWIKHRENGFIYDVDDSMVDRMAHDIIELAGDPVLQGVIRTNIRITEKEKLWTWNDRLQAELSEIDMLLESGC